MGSLTTCLKKAGSALHAEPGSRVVVFAAGTPVPAQVRDVVDVLAVLSGERQTHVVLHLVATIS